MALGQVFSEYFGFPCQFSFHRLLRIHHHLSSGSGTIGLLLADTPSELSPTSPQESKTKKNPKEREKSVKVFVVIYFATVSECELYGGEMKQSRLVRDISGYLGRKGRKTMKVLSLAGVSRSRLQPSNRYHYIILGW
jgi:hypothetical protein